MKALDKQAWAAAYNSEYLGFKQREVFKIVKPEPGVRIHDILTRLEYKEDNCEFLKCKVCLCARGDQQESGVSFQESDLYAPVLKAAEARLLLALAAAGEAKVVKTDTKHPICTGIWGMTLSIFDHQTGGQNRYRKDTCFSYPRAFMVRGMPPVNGILIYQHGWKRMDMRR